jgi:hypothetical protein
MFWKLLLTAAVILGAYLVIRGRMNRARRPEPGAPASACRLPAGLVRTAAYAALVLMLGGTGLYLIRGWDKGREILRVQVVNANTGVVIDYRARRRDIAGRDFRTLDGQEVRLADVERLILTRADP